MCMKTCSVSGCPRKSRARGWCKLHYQRWKKWGDPEHIPPRGAKTTIAERFAVSVDRTGGVGSGGVATIGRGMPELLTRRKMYYYIDGRTSTSSGRSLKIMWLITSATIRVVSTRSIFELVRCRRTVRIVCAPTGTIDRQGGSESRLTRCSVVWARSMTLRLPPGSLLGHAKNCMISLRPDPRDIPIAVPRNPAPVEGVGFRCKLL